MEDIMLNKTEITTLNPTTGEPMEWYTYDDPLNLPIARAWMASAATRRLKLVLTGEELDKMLLRQEQFMNQGLIVDAAHINKVIQERRTHYGYEDAYIEYATACTVCPSLGEDAEKWNPIIAKKKASILAQEGNEEARFFFIFMVATIIYDVSQFTQDSFLQLLQEQNLKWSEQSKMLYS